MIETAEQQQIRGVRASRAAYLREWRRKNPEKSREIQRRWRENHPEEVKAAQERYWKKRLEQMRRAGEMAIETPETSANNIP